MARAISRKFEELKARSEGAFIPFVTAGDPDLETTIRIVPALERGGGHIVELGIPFSDPLADGPTIQRSSERALANGYGIGDYLGGRSAHTVGNRYPGGAFQLLQPCLEVRTQKGLLRRHATRGRTGSSSRIWCPRRALITQP